jgi:hypothetical protein
MLMLMERVILVIQIFFKITENIEEDLKRMVSGYTDQKTKVFKAARTPKDGNLKYSACLYVEAKISYSIIPLLFKEPIDKYNGDVKMKSLIHPFTLLIEGYFFR